MFWESRSENVSSIRARSGRRPRPRKPRDVAALSECRKGFCEVGEVLCDERRFEPFSVVLVEEGHDRPLVAGGEIGEEVLHRREVADVQVEGDAARPERLVGEHDRFGVGKSRVRTDELGAELPELPVPAFLGTLVAETVGEVAPADRFGEDLALVDVHPQHRRRHLRPERHLSPALVLERRTSL
jgi:hypothetical protein